MSNSEIRPPVRQVSQWWISVDANTCGPYSTAYILASLKAGRMDASALACPYDHDQWKTLAEWPQFQEFAGPVHPQPSDSWYVDSHDGNRYGPVYKTELDRWVTAGQVTPQCRLLQEGRSQWLEAVRVFPDLVDSTINEITANLESEDSMGIQSARRRVAGKRARRYSFFRPYWIGDKAMLVICLATLVLSFLMEKKRLLIMSVVFGGIALFRIITAPKE